MLKYLYLDQYKVATISPLRIIQRPLDLISDISSVLQLHMYCKACGRTCSTYSDIYIYLYGHIKPWQIYWKNSDNITRDYLSTLHR